MSEQPTPGGSGPALDGLSDEEVRERYARLLHEEREEYHATLSARSFLSNRAHLQNPHRDEERRRLEDELRRRGLA